MNNLYYNFFYPGYERIDFPTDNRIAKLSSLLLEPGRAVFWKKVVVFDKDNIDNIPSVRTIENPIKHPIFAVALRIILWIPTFLGILCVELARVTSTKIWEVERACVMDILNHDKWESSEERKITASKIWRVLTLNKMETLADDLYNKYKTNQDKMAGSQAAFMRIEVIWWLWDRLCSRPWDRLWSSPLGGLCSWNCYDFGELEELRFASMSDEAVVKWASLSPSLVDILCYLPPDRQQSILNQLKFDKKIVELLSDLSKQIYDEKVERIPLASRELLVKIVNERFANHIISHPSLAIVIDEFKESICPSIDLSWIFAGEHCSLLKNLLNHISDEKNEKWLFSLALSAFNTHNLDIFLSLLTERQIHLLYSGSLFVAFGAFCCRKLHQMRIESFKLILKYKDIRSKLGDFHFKECCDEMAYAYTARNIDNERYFPRKKLRNQDEYKFLFSPCGGEIESLRNIPCSLLKIYFDAIKDCYICELYVELPHWFLTSEEYKDVFRLHPMPPGLQEKIRSLESEKIKEMIQKKRNDYLEHFNTILYLDELVFLKIYHEILTNEEKAYILELSHQEQEKASTYLPSSLQIMCMRVLHENPELMKQEECNEGLLASIDAYESLYL